MNKITIPNNMLQEATPLAVTLYSTISIYAKYAITEGTYINMPREKLQYDLYGQNCKTTFMVKNILAGIAELEELKILKYNSDTKMVAIRRDAFWPDKYVGILGTELSKILTIGEPGYFQWLLFYYYCHIVRSFNSYITIEERNNIIGTMAQSYFADLLDLNINTIRKYNKCLTENNLLYIAHIGNQKTNMYCRYEDRGLLKKYLKAT